MKNLQIVFILLMIPSAGFSQEEGAPRTYSPSFYKVEPTDEMRSQMQEIGDSMRHASKAMSSGRNEILESLTIEDLNTLSDFPLTEDQTSQLRKIMTSYQKSVAGLEYSDPSHRLAMLTEKKTHLEKIEGVLLPEQVSSIAAKAKVKRRLISRIVASKLAREMNLTAEQKERLIDEAILINEQIQSSLQEVKRLTEKHQKSVLEACKKVLTEEQLHVLDSNVNHDALVKTMSLKDLLIDTKLLK